MKNETEILGLINKIQTQLWVLERKIDSLISRNVEAAKPVVKTPVINNQTPVRYPAICADCKKECTIPFKPSPERAVYCKDCFSRRKVISLSKIGMDHRPKEEAALEPAIVKTVEPKKPPVKRKKKAVAAKKKTAPKKK